MQDFEKRVVSQLCELDDRMEKLSAFMYGDVFPTLLDVDQVLLRMQLRAMVPYAAVLSDRIERFTG